MPRSSPTQSSPVHERLIHPFVLTVPQTALDELTSRLGQTRWPDELPGTGADYGAVLSFVRETARVPGAPGSIGVCKKPRSMPFPNSSRRSTDRMSTSSTRARQSLARCRLF